MSLISPAARCHQQVFSLSTVGGIVKSRGRDQAVCKSDYDGMRIGSSHSSMCSR